MTTATMEMLPMPRWLSCDRRTRPRRRVGQDASRRAQDVYGAQKCQICHAIAGKGNKTNPLDGVGGKLCADDIKQWITHPTEMTREDEVDQEAADAGQLRQPSGGRHRRARGVHAEPEVSTPVASRRARSPGIRSRSPA